MHNTRCGVLQLCPNLTAWSDGEERDVAGEGAAHIQQASACRSFDQHPLPSNYLFSHDSPSTRAVIEQCRYAIHMNWTGGSLQRTKKANAGVLQQQKAYFAKARTQLQNATDSHVAPLRPNHLIDNDKFDIWNLVPLGSGSVRWPTGHTAKRPSERTQREPTPDKRRLTRTSYERHSKNLLRRSPSNSNAKVRIHRGISGDLLLTCCGHVKMD